MSESKVEKVTYLLNHKRSLPLQMGGMFYTIPAGKTTIPELAEKLGVTEDQAWKVAKHAARTYAAIRQPTKPNERSSPPETYVEIVSEVVESITVYKASATGMATETYFNDRVTVFQDVEEFLDAVVDEQEKSESLTESVSKIKQAEASNKDLANMSSEEFREAIFNRSLNKVTDH